MRYPLVIGNWKLNGSKHMVDNLITVLRNKLNGVIGCEIAIAPPVIYLTMVKDCLGISQIALGAQNVDTHLSGPYTGEVSAEMLKDIGVKYIIIGHSERRLYHKESDDFIAEKFTVIKEVGLIPVLCIGENLIENKAGQTKAICTRQIDVILNSLGAKAFKDAVIAYEPIWAIGTGKSATPIQVQAVHKHIRGHIAKHDIAIAEQVIIQYGGSVNSANASALFKQPDIDGVLIGGASLSADTFIKIIKTAAEIKHTRLPELIDI